MIKLSPQPTANSNPKLLDRGGDILRANHYSYKTEQNYILFHNKRHPQETGEAEISRFLTHLAVNMNVLKLGLKGGV